MSTRACHPINNWDWIFANAQTRSVLIYFNQHLIRITINRMPSAGWRWCAVLRLSMYYTTPSHQADSTMSQRRTKSLISDSHLASLLTVCIHCASMLWVLIQKRQKHIYPYDPYDMESTSTLHSVQPDYGLRPIRDPSSIRECWLWCNCSFLVVLPSSPAIVCRVKDRFLICL